MNSRGIKSVKVGENFTGYCIVRKKEMKQKRNGAAYLKLELGDASGRLGTKIWKQAEHYNTVMKVGQLLKVTGQIRSYGQVKELQLARFTFVKEGIEEMKEAMVPVSQKNISEMMEKFDNHLHSVSHKNLTKLLNRIFRNDTFKQKYLRMPCGKLWHHHYLYGNLEHLICLLDLADTVYHHYPMLNIDLLKSGIFLRSLGNLNEFSVNGFINYSTTGRLLGQTVLSYQAVQDYISEIEEFPDELKLQLNHLLLSCENGLEKTAHVKAMTMEAILLNLLIQVDIQINAVERIAKNDMLENSRWTKFNNLLNRYIYAGDHSE